MNFKRKETLKSLIALSVGDSIGENYLKVLPKEMYKAGNVASERGSSSLFPWTDDTHMAIGLARILFTYNEVKPLELAIEFAKNLEEDPQRGYGKGTFSLLRRYKLDACDWEKLSSGWWRQEDGTTTGSKGNGSAMRDSIIGSHFENLDDVIKNAELSAKVTHYHPEAIAGSIAVAVAANCATYNKPFWETILACTPCGIVLDMISRASKLNGASVIDAIYNLGNGLNVTAFDTVPYVLWMSNEILSGRISFEEAIKLVLRYGGDTDTVCAIIGGIVGNRVELSSDDLELVEKLPADLY